MINPEKVPDAPFRHAIYAGIELQSRYGKRADFEAMMAAVDFVFDRLGCHRAVMRIYCDTKAGSCFEFVLWTVPDDVARRVIAEFDLAFRMTNGGHNGILVVGKEDLDIDPFWEGD